ncbi:MAG: hypothetical protein K0U93_15930 [Gammaproteobacteria bacterium]|nr:hypothetical protein [Gammaproteobacteria bacterium]
MPTILFLCPHNAAKSVIAATYFRALAAREGIPFEASTAGTDPDAEIWPSVIAMLREAGLEVEPATPRTVQPEDFQRAHRVVSLGCDVANVAGNTPVEHWDGVPMPSKDLGASRDAIARRVQALVTELKSNPG